MTNLSKKKWKLIVVGTSIALLSTTSIAIGISLPSLISANSQQNLIEIEKAYNKARKLPIFFLPKTKDILSLTTASKIKKSDLIIEPNTNVDLIYKIISLDVVSETNIKITIMIQSKLLKKSKQYVIEIKGLPNKQESLQFNALRKIQKIISTKTSISNENYFSKPDLASLKTFTPSEHIAKTDTIKPTFKFLKDIQKYEKDFNIEFVRYKNPNDQIGTMMMVFKIISKKFPKKIFGDATIIAPIVNSQDRKTKLAKINKIILEQSFKPKLINDKIKSNKLANALVLSDFTPFNPLNKKETKKIIDGVTIQFASNNEWNVSNVNDIIEGVARIKLEVFISGDSYFEANKKSYTIKLQNFLTLENLIKKFRNDKNSIKISISSPLNLNKYFPSTSPDHFSLIENFFTISASPNLIKQFPNGFFTFSIQPETFEHLDYVNGQIKAKVLVSLKDHSKFDPDGKYNNIVSPLKQLLGFLTEEKFRNKYLEINANAFIHIYYNNPLLNIKKEIDIENSKLDNLEGNSESNPLLNPSNYSLFRLKNRIKIDTPNALNLENIPNSSSFGELKNPKISIEDKNPLTGKLTLGILFTVRKTTKTSFSPKSIKKTITIKGYEKIENNVEKALNAAEMFLKSSINNIKVANKIIKFNSNLPEQETLPSNVQISKLSFATSAEIKIAFPNNNELNSIKIEKQSVFLNNKVDSDGTITLNIIISTINKANGGTFNKKQSRSIKITVNKFATSIVNKINNSTITIFDDISKLRKILPSEFISQNNDNPSKLNTAFKTLIKSVTINSGQLPIASWSIKLSEVEDPIANDKDGQMEFKFKILYASQESKEFTLFVPGFKNSIESNLDNAKIKLKNNFKPTELPSSLTKELFKSMIVGFEEISGTIIPLSSYVISDFTNKAYNNIPLAVVSFKISRTIAENTYTSLIKKTFDSKNTSVSDIATNIIGKNHLISSATKAMKNENFPYPQPHFKNTIPRTIETLSNNDFEFKNIQQNQKDLYIYSLSDFKIATNPTNEAANLMDAIVTISLNPQSAFYKASSTQKDATITYKVTNIIYKKI